VEFETDGGTWIELESCKVNNGLVKLGLNYYCEVTMRELIRRTNKPPNDGWNIKTFVTVKVSAQYKNFCGNEAINAVTPMKIICPAKMPGFFVDEDKIEANKIILHWKTLLNEDAGGIDTLISKF